MRPGGRTVATGNRTRAERPLCRSQFHELPRFNDTPRQQQETRRLFYVGITRAQVEVHLVHTLGRASEFVAEIQARTYPS